MNNCGLLVFGLILLSSYGSAEDSSSSKCVSTPVSQCDGIVVCYYGSWSIYRPGKGIFGISDIPADLCTHISFSFIFTDAEGSIFFPDPPATIAGKNNELAELVKLKEQNRDLKIVMAMGGFTAASTNFTIVANNDTLRAKMVQNTYDFLVENNIDGLSMDWEYPAQMGGNASDKDAYIDLLRDLKEKFGSKFELSATVAATQYNIDLSYNVPEMNKYLDYIFIMAYDLHGSWESVTGVNAPLYSQLTDPQDQINFSVNTSVYTWINNGASPEKIVVGLGSYGRTFTLASLNNTATGAPATGAGIAGTYSGQPGIWTYYEICEDQQVNAAQWSVTTVPGNYAYANKGTFWVGYDNVETIKAKGAYARRLGLGGIGFWSLDQDDFLGTCGEQYPITKAASGAYCNWV